MKDAIFDSKEELFFSWYCEELLQARFIVEYEYHVRTYRLCPDKTYPVVIPMKTKIKTGELSLLKKHTYTPDVWITWSEKARNVFFNSMNEKVDLRKVPFVTTHSHLKTLQTVVEIKPAYDQNNMTRLFRINQKWLFHQNDIYVNEIVCVKKPPKGGNKSAGGLFPSTFTPARYLMTDKARARRKLCYKPKLLKEFLREGM